MTDTILVLNAGSSSVKFQLFEYSKELPRLLVGSVVGIGTKPILSIEREGTDKKLKIEIPVHETQKQGVQRIIDWIEDLKEGWVIKVVAHRFVHGGPEFFEPTFINAEVFHKLKAIIPLALLHQPHHLAAVSVIEKRLKNIPQIACFDTAFHAHHAAKFTNFAIPQEMTDKGVRRYGFHGLSYAWSAQYLKKHHPDLAKGRVVVAHLGNGSSLCAMHNCKSVDTTMGMTVLDGLPMGTRCGHIDAGAVFYMIRELKLSHSKVEEILYKESGLKGMSGISNDVKTLQESSDARAEYALDYFAHHTAKFIASMAASLGGIDALVFTGGIGENSVQMRESILGYLEFLKIPKVMIINANEERYMAEQALECMSKAHVAGHEPHKKSPAAKHKKPAAHSKKSA
ncbi:MAG: acetate/propionate family kinase [Alphaproteobacteria bacterium]|nr:acetate/propionate family kinase [Alphaproteobacteria bacterium]MCL2504723.1 acetate/propionate family kinase [Alphaproteobacteria bacterium]